MLLAHLPVGYSVTHAVIKKFKLKFSWPWLSLGMFAAVLPDFGIIYQLFSGRLYESHRYYITNLPVFYLTVFIIIVIVNCFIHKRWLTYANYLIFANIFVHLLLDTVYYGIRWLWPFYPKLIAIYNTAGNGGFRVDNYFHHWYWYLEIVIVIFVPLFIVNSFLRGKYEDQGIKKSKNQ